MNRNELLAGIAEGMFQHRFRRSRYVKSLEQADQQTVTEYYGMANVALKICEEWLVPRGSAGVECATAKSDGSRSLPTVTRTTGPKPLRTTAEGPQRGNATEPGGESGHQPSSQSSEEPLDEFLPEDDPEVIV